MITNFDKLVSDFSKFRIEANSDGLIPIYNVLMVQLPISFYNGFSLKLLKSIITSSCKFKIPEQVSEDLYGYAGGLLENAAAECGYHTGCGVINSDEFEAVMGSLTEKPEDILYGLFAVVNSWGWGDLKIEELIPNEKMILRAYDYYEADIKNIFKCQKYLAYKLTGISRAFMDLVYGNKCPPQRLGVFKSKQTMGIEMGDDYGEFIVTKE